MISMSDYDRILNWIPWRENFQDFPTKILGKAPNKTPLGPVVAGLLRCVASRVAVARGLGNFDSPKKMQGRFELPFSWGIWILPFCARVLNFWWWSYPPASWQTLLQDYTDNGKHRSWPCRSKITFEGTPKSSKLRPCHGFALKDPWWLEDPFTNPILHVYSISTFTNICPKNGLT